MPLWPFARLSPEPPPQSTVDQIVTEQRQTNLLLRALIDGLVARGVPIVKPTMRMIPIGGQISRPRRVYTEADITQVTREMVAQQERDDQARAIHLHRDPRADQLMPAESGPVPPESTDPAPAPLPPE